jgi:hypothetical protein
LICIIVCHYDLRRLCSLFRTTYVTLTNIRSLLWIRGMQESPWIRAIRRKTLWKWRAHIREQAWMNENSALADALSRERQEAARLRETVYLLQENLTHVETTKYVSPTHARDMLHLSAS